MTFGERLRKLREGKFSQEQLADLLHVHNNTISKWENGTQEPRTKRITELAKIFNTTPAYLLGDTDNPTTPTINQTVRDSISELARDLADSEFNMDAPITGGMTHDMFIINDKNSNHVYYLPNNEEGRNLFLSVLSAGLQNASHPPISNIINGNNNNDNQLGLINEKKEAQKGINTPC